MVYSTTVLFTLVFLLQLLLNASGQTVPKRNKMGPQRRIIYKLRRVSLPTLRTSTTTTTTEEPKSTTPTEPTTTLPPILVTGHYVQDHVFFHPEHIPELPMGKASAILAHQMIPIFKMMLLGPEE